MKIPEAPFTELLRVIDDWGHAIVKHNSHLRSATIAPVLSVKATPEPAQAPKETEGDATPDMENKTGCPPLKVPLMKTTFTTEDIMLAVAMGEPEAGRLNVTGVELSAGHTVGLPDELMRQPAVSENAGCRKRETEMVTLEPTMTMPPSACDADPADAKSCVVDTVMPLAVAA